jgi:hypothetical protein
LYLAHGKRSFNPQQQQQRNAPKPDDILASLRSFPDRVRYSVIIKFYIWLELKYDQNFQDQLIQIRKFLAATRQIPSYNEIQKDLESSQSFGVGNSLDEENRNNNDFLENSDSEKMNARFRVKRSARKIFI